MDTPAKRLKLNEAARDALHNFKDDGPGRVALADALRATARETPTAATVLAATRKSVAAMQIMCEAQIVPRALFNGLILEKALCVGVDSARFVKLKNPKVKLRLDNVANIVQQLAVTGKIDALRFIFSKKEGSEILPNVFSFGNGCVQASLYHACASGIDEVTKFMYAELVSRLVVLPDVRVGFWALLWRVPELRHAQPNVQDVRDCYSWIFRQKVAPSDDCIFHLAMNDEAFIFQEGLLAMKGLSMDFHFKPSDRFEIYQTNWMNKWRDTNIIITPALLMWRMYCTQLRMEMEMDPLSEAQPLKLCETQLRLLLLCEMEMRNRASTLENDAGWSDLRERVPQKDRSAIIGGYMKYLLWKKVKTFRTWDKWLWSTREKLAAETWHPDGYAQQEETTRVMHEVDEFVNGFNLV